MDGGHTMFMNKQYDSSNQEKHYNDDLINGGSETPVAISEPVETQGNLNEEIIKNIAVEKELSEIASAYNLHRNEGDSKTDELIGMDVDPPKDFKDVSESDKSVPSGKHFFFLHHMSKVQNSPMKNFLKIVLVQMEYT
jgi:hypothetical protein